MEIEPYPFKHPEKGMVIQEMGRLRMFFYMPKFIIENNKIRIHERYWTNPDAEKLYRQYEELLSHILIEEQQIRKSEREKIADKLCEIADKYEKDGEPQSLGYNTWGWRDIAKHLRETANQLRSE